MPFVKQDQDDGLAILRLARGKANAIDDAMLDELQTAFGAANDDNDVRGIVLASDSPRFFSSGFDVGEVFAYDRDTMRAFFGRFIDLYETVLHSPRPVVASISGHAFAGGAILALACDGRLFAEGNYGFALNEVNLGIVIPPGVMRMAIAAVGLNAARQLVLAGRTWAPQQAARTGLALELTPPDAALPKAVEHAHRLAGLPPQAFAALKRRFVQTTLGPDAGDRQFLEQFLDHWFSPEARQRQQALLQSMRK